ncbi:MAG: ComEC/Rec2 family competence protein [Candidatus Uhrbacteria bacterium]|nr:ComEC/Rec2 family competence protein [Candidatus Uhrbacteria bacterium]
MWELGFKKIIASPSRTFMLLAAMFCFGILLGPLTIGISTNVYVASLAICVLSFAFTPPSQGGVGGGRIIALVIFLFIFGLFRYQQSEIPKNIPTVRDHVGSLIRVEGDVVSEPSMGAKSQQVTIGHVHVVDAPVFGNVLVSLPLTGGGSGWGHVFYGDHLVFSCSMQIPRPFSGFAYDRYLQAKGTLALCRFPHDLERVPSTHVSVVGSILALKGDIVLLMKRVFPEPHASFLFGLVFGGNVGLDKDLQNDFAKTGTSHILAASGFNVSLFTFVFFGFVIQYLGRKRGAIATAILLVAYVIMAGATAAVVRAAVFGSVLLVGSTIGRRASIVNTLLFTAALMLFYNPRWLLDDVGFQLSFVAFVAIIFVAPRLETHLAFVPEQLGIRDALAGSLSAIVLTLPIMLWQFGAISLVAPFANVFVLPIVPFLMLYTIVILPIAWISTSIGQLIALPSLFGSKYMLAIISTFASPGFASVSVPFAHIGAIVIAIALGIGCVAYLRKA